MDTEQPTPFMKKSQPQLSTDAWLKYVIMATLLSAVIVTLMMVF